MRAAKTDVFGFQDSQKITQQQDAAQCALQDGRLVGINAMYLQLSGCSGLARHTKIKAKHAACLMFYSLRLQTLRRSLHLIMQVVRI